MRKLKPIWDKLMKEPKNKREFNFRLAKDFDLDWPSGDGVLPVFGKKRMKSEDQKREDQKRED